MSVVGHGIDLVPVARIAELVERHGERFLARVFTPAERARGEGSRRAHEHLAARFAAKEAVFKALGTGWGEVSWTDVEVTNLASGQPTLTLRGNAAGLALARGVVEWRISLTHAGGYAAASVVACGP